jgi:hypothetical protein
MDKIKLDIIKLRWHVQILQGMLVQLWATSISALMDESPQESLHRMLAELDSTQAYNYDLLLSSAPESERALLAEEFAQLVEGIRTFVTSMSKAS